LYLAVAWAGGAAGSCRPGPAPTAPRARSTRRPCRRTGGQPARCRRSPHPSVPGEVYWPGHPAGDLAGHRLGPVRHGHGRSLGIRQHRGDVRRAGRLLQVHCTRRRSRRGLEYESAGVDRPQKAMTAGAVRTRQHQNRGCRHAVARDEQLRSILANETSRPCVPAYEPLNRMEMPASRAAYATALCSQ